MDETRYSRSHEWARREDDRMRIGISDRAQEELGDIVYIELPGVGSRIGAGETCGVVESVKAAADIYAPVGGIVAEVNEKLQDDPGLVNRDPEGEGWLLVLEGASAGEWAALLSFEEYIEVP